MLPFIGWLKVCNASVVVFSYVVCVNCKDVFHIIFDVWKQVWTSENFTFDMRYCSWCYKEIALLTWRFFNYKLIYLFVIIICRLLSPFLDYGEVLHPAENILTVTW